MKTGHSLNFSKRKERVGQGRRCAEGQGRRPPLPYGRGFARCILPSAFVILLCGCSAGNLELVSLDFRSIDPPAAQVTRLPLDRCFWWTDESGRLWLAMERIVQIPFLSNVDFEFQLSLRLDRPPQGKARNYTVRDAELRAAARVGPAESRFSSLAGILAVYRESGDRLRGSLRLQVARQVNAMLTGWTQPTRYLMLGSFVAEHDEVRGRAIAERTETDGFERDVPSAAGAAISTRPVGGG
ncbi:MAG: hypothetical protein CHACPFDD_01577 [Phycisphaerae bacterium]|nr:hypothetical protein [Phycisphaerae bacterium]